MLLLIIIIIFIKHLAYRDAVFEFDQLMSFADHNFFLQEYCPKCHWSDWTLTEHLNLTNYNNIVQSCSVAGSDIICFWCRVYNSNDIIPDIIACYKPYTKIV